MNPFTWLRRTLLAFRLWSQPMVQKWVVRRWWSCRHRKELVRFSISALVRIKVDDKYLLVKNRKWPKYQPVGGVLQVYQGGKSTLQDLGVLSDNMLPIDDINREDLRVQVPGKNIAKFLEWYDSARNRENDPHREFREELFQTGIVSSESFGHPKFNFLRQHVCGVKPCKHLDGDLECKIAEIYDLEITPEQRSLLENLQSEGSNLYIWADDSQIRCRGVIPKQQEIETITETAEWIL
ncbi:MAG: hypothetical protein WD490_10700 [Opitutales bacterium]